jgi:hypothetical protein
MPRRSPRAEARRRNASPPPQPTSARARGSQRVVVFALLCGICVVVVAAYAVFAAQRTQQQSVAASADTPASPEALASIVAQPHLVFLHSPTGDAYRRVAIVPLDATDGPRYLTPLQCQRVYFEAGQGLCLGNNYVGGIASEYDAFSFDEQFHVGATYDESGLPIRVRLSPNGQLGAMTVFVTGHSYSDVAFSTLTNLVDTRAGQIVTDLEKFSIERDGAPFHSVDFNFWGVTFARDNDHFYATLGSGGKTYLLEGAVSTRQARVLLDNVECPSLSPDNTRIAFKQRKSGDTRTWRLAVLDLASMTVSPVPGEARNIDDQVEWLDDNHILYAVQQDGSLATDIWQATLDGSEQPRIFVHQALSPAVVR